MCTAARPQHAMPAHGGFFTPTRARTALSIYTAYAVLTSPCLSAISPYLGDPILSAHRQSLTCSGNNGSRQRATPVSPSAGSRPTRASASPRMHHFLPPRDILLTRALYSVYYKAPLCFEYGFRLGGLENSRVCPPAARAPRLLQML